MYVFTSFVNQKPKLHISQLDKQGNDEE